MKYKSVLIAYNDKTRIELKSEGPYTVEYGEGCCEVIYHGTQGRLLVPFSAVIGIEFREEVVE